MRPCPKCHLPMSLRSARDTTFDFCDRCEGVFLDANKGRVAGLEVTLFQGFSARSGGRSQRLCPDHGEAMALLIVETHAGTRTIERAPCCGGLFLESGDAMALIGRGPEGPSARVEGPVGKTCPLCHSGLSPTVLHEFEVDECAACDHIFFDGGEAEKAGIDTQALFGDGPGSAQATGAGGACPSCDTPMHRYRAEMAMGPAVEASFAACCGGVWVARGLEPRLRSAARCAVSKRADQQFMSGQPVQATAATRTPEELRASQVAMERYQSVVEKQRVLAARDARRARQGGILENLGFDFDGDSSCGSDCD